MGVKENKEAIRRLHEQGYPSGPDGLERWFTPGYVDHAMWGDLAGLKSAMKAFRATYPSVSWKIEDMFGEGDRVVVRATMRIGSGTGTLRSFSAITIYRFDGPRIAETWAYGDSIR